MLCATNIRMGFANNSSSTHSILLCNASSHGLRDRLIDRDTLDGSPDFGWERFVCASPEAKAKYFACQLAATLRCETNAEIAGLVVNALLGVPLMYGKGGVDHQSSLVFPRYPDGSLAISFIKELFDDAVSNPQIVVCGGNDNDDKPNPIQKKGTEHAWFASLPRDERCSMLIARPEPYGWCLFNKDTGARIRLQRKDAKTDLPQTPELIDVKITNYCIERHCEFCYQNSDHDGKHGDTKWLEHLCWTLQKIKVFEVVLGGGEPTRHPDFLDLIQKLHEYHRIVPNFTTASYNWLHKPEFVATVNKHVGSVAFSCQTHHDLEGFGRAILLAGEELAKKAVFQSIVGIVPPEELAKMIDLADSFGFNKYSLVGFKAFGRAPQKPPHNINKYNLKKLIKDRYMRFYVDTALLQQCPELVEEQTCDVTEGKQSMYIDAVAKTMAASSYTQDVVEFKRKDFPMEEEILAAFKKFQATGQQMRAKSTRRRSTRSK